MNFSTQQKQSYRYREQSCGFWGLGGGINWEIGTDIYTLLYMKDRAYNNFLWSTGNSTQHSNGLYGKRI